MSEDAYECRVGYYVPAPRYWWITVEGERIGKWFEDGRIEMPPMTAPQVPRSSMGGDT